MKDLNEERLEQLYTIKKYKKVRLMTEQEKKEHEKQLRKDRNQRFYRNKQIEKEFGKENVPKLQKKKYQFKTIPVSQVINIETPNNNQDTTESEGSIADHYELLLELYDLNDSCFDDEIEILEDYFGIS